MTAWGSRVADSWAGATLTIAAVPIDRNTTQEAREIRELLCQPDRSSARASGPGRQQTFCAHATLTDCHPGDSVIDLLAELSIQHGSIDAARNGERPDAFYGAISGLRLPRNESISHWAERVLRHAWPSGGGPQAHGHLHVPALLSCPLPSLRQPPLPEGAELVELPPDSDDALREAADAGVDALWPLASTAERLYLRARLLDLSSGHLADLHSIADVFAERLSLQLVRAGASMEWHPADPPVIAAEEELLRLGFESGSLRWPGAPGMDDVDLRGALWEQGLLRLPASNWQEGLTARGWAALGLAGPARPIERPVLEVLRDLLELERIVRQIVLERLSNARSRALVHEALWDIEFERGSLADQISSQVPDAVDWSIADDEAYVSAASFGHLFHLLRLSGGGMRQGMLDRVRDAVKARNAAAHGRLPTLQEFCRAHENAATAKRWLYTLLR